MINRKNKKGISIMISYILLISIAVVMSLITYLADGNFSILDNILNTTDIILVTTVSVFIFIFGDNSCSNNSHIEHFRGLFPWF